jgi:hypothetical protein
VHDLTDPLIGEMVKEGHKPEEIYHWSPAPIGKTLAHIICGACADLWPCSVIVYLRQRQEQNGTGQHL